MATGTSFRGPLKHGPQGVGTHYGYRNGLGMMNSAEYIVFHDDFQGPVATNVPHGWQAAIIDTGCTITNANLIGGVLVFDSDADDEGAAFYGHKWVTLTADKRFFMETRVKMEDVSAMTFMFGCAALTATTNPEDLWTTTEATGFAFGNLDAATFSLNYDLSNAGTVTDTSTETLTDDTWATLGVGYDGGNMFAYHNGKQIIAASTPAQIPVGVVMAPFVGMLAGHATTADITHVDYVRIAMER